MIFEDILYDNKKYDADQMCMERFKSIPITRLVPVYKYMKSYAAWTNNAKLVSYATAHNSIDLLIPSNIKKQIANIPNITDYQQLVSEISSVSEINKKAGLLLKNLKICSTEEIREFCKEFVTLDKELSMKSTHFKRCVMYIDLCENFLN